MNDFWTRRQFLTRAAGSTASLALAGAAARSLAYGAGTAALQGRFLTHVSVVRVNQIEVTPTRSIGLDEAKDNRPDLIRSRREAFARGCPGGRMTWAISWLALHDTRQEYKDARRLLASYHEQYGDEITFIPGGYHAPMYDTPENIRKTIHTSLHMISEMVGNGYRPQCLVAGFLGAENQRYLATEEGIHVCQGQIWSQHAIDYGDGDGGICYPYYPSRQHFCKPAQNKADLIDCVNLDGWTMDFLAARRRGFDGGFNSRMGVGPIETVFAHGPEKGLRQMVETTAVHFDSGFNLNGFGWVTNCWEVCLVPRSIDSLTLWLQEIRRRWPATLCVTQGEFGLAWRRQFQANDPVDYRFVQRGTGIGGSDADKQIRWFMNRDFRLALLRDWKNNGPEQVIDFTRYDLPTQEPPDATPDKPARNWSVMNRINQKGTRPQDKPILLAELPAEDRDFIRRRHPELLQS